jgi:hypothetical protein
MCLYCQPANISYRTIVSRARRPPQDVAPGSPADKAGLVSGDDFILGVPGVMLGSVRTLV